MSVSLLLQTPTPAQEWKNLRINNLTLDGELTLSNDSKAVLSSGFNDYTLVFGLEAIEGSLLNYAESSDILPVNITYDNEYINVDQSGTYSISLQFTLQIQSFTANTTFDLIFFNDSDTSDVCESQYYVTHGNQFTMSINRTLHLEANKNYSVLIRQSVVQNTALIGSSNRSFISLYKLF